MSKQDLLTIFRAFLPLLIISGVQIGCGRPVSSGDSAGEFDSSSRLPVNIVQQQNSPKDIAICNKLETDHLTAQLMIFYDQTNSYRPEYLRLWIPKIHSDFADSKFQLVLRKWKASVEGETYQDNTPLRLRLERMTDHFPVTNYMNAIHWNTISSELQKTVSTNFTLSEALEKFSFVVDLKDPTGTFDVLKLSLYHDGDWIQDWNVLIPAFYAHPQTYAETQNAVLAELHPFYGNENSTFDGPHFAGVLNGFCF